jgi:hypothetical protein
MFPIATEKNDHGISDKRLIVVRDLGVNITELEVVHWK